VHIVSVVVVVVVVVLVVMIVVFVAVDVVWFYHIHLSVLTIAGLKTIAN
jgi:hypothetical protein